MKKVPFSSYAREAHVRRMKKKVCWSAIGSDSHIFLHASYMSLSCTLCMRSLVEIHNNIMTSQKEGVLKADPNSSLCECMEQKCAALEIDQLISFLVK